MDEGVGGFLIGCFVTMLIVSQCVPTATKLKKEAIEKGFAEYHQTTGKWQWKEAMEGAQDNE